MVFVLLLSALALVAQDRKVDSLQILLKSATDTTEVRILNQLSETFRRQKPLEAIAFGEKALSKAEKIGFKPGIVLALHNIGLGYGFNNDYNKTIDYLLRSAQLAEQINLLKSAANDYTNIGSGYAIQGDQQKWLLYYLKALKLYEMTGDKKGMGSVLYGIGNSLASEKKYEKALDNYFKSIEYFESLNERRELPKVHVNVGKAYEEMKDYPRALANYEKALRGFKEFNNRRGRASALVYRAGTYYHQTQYDQALADLTESIHISQESNYQVSIIENLILTGKVRLAKKQYDQAIDNLSQASEIAKKMGSKSSLSTAYQLLADVYFQKGDFKNAFAFQGLHSAYYDSAFSAEKSKQIQEMQFRFDTEKKEKEIEILKQDQFLNRIYQGIAFFSVLFVLIIAFLIINRQKLKIRIERELSQKENQLLEERKSLIEAELLNRKLNEESLHHEIEFKNKEMTTYALNLIQKNELLENIKLGIEEVRAADTNQIKPKLQSLLNKVNYSFHLDRDWENFKMHFEQVHRTFFDRLRDLNPDLGANDLKLCALIRLNLDTKAMATVLDISPESAKVARHRLRKKLNLLTEQNLASFLSNM